MTRQSAVAAVTHFESDLNFADAARKNLKPFLNQIPELRNKMTLLQDLQAALPALGIILPKGSSLQTGTLSTNLNIQGPLRQLVTTGNVGLFNAKLAGFDMGSKMAALSAFSASKEAAATLPFRS